MHEQANIKGGKKQYASKEMEKKKQKTDEAFHTFFKHTDNVVDWFVYSLV